MKINDSNAKDTVYVDVEDDITVIIDKVTASNSKVVALVLPKRATTLQSVVNLKLLNKSAKKAKKSLVLISSEAGLLPLAGAAGMHVAKTLQSKPEIPKAPSSETNNTDESSVASVAVGAMAGHIAAEETIDLDNDTKPELNAAKKDTKKKFNSKFKVPNFNKFRLFLFSGIGLFILLVVGGVFAFVILPKASVSIKTDTTNIETELKITANSDVTAVNGDNFVLPAITKSLNKSETEKAVVSGKRDDGEKAKGTVTITNCNADNDKGITLASGTVLTSSNGASLSFITNETVTIPQSDFTGSGVCKSNQFKNVDVTAQNPGGQYNISSNISFSTPISGLTGKNGSSFSGGTSKIVQVVSQSDVDGARQRVIDKMNISATEELKQQFISDNSLPLSDTFSAGNPKVVATPNVNEPATEVSVSVTITFTELGVKNDDLKQIVENDINKNIDTSKQVIQDNGIEGARVQVVEKKSDKEVVFSISTVAVAGPQLDTDGIKNEIAGKNKKETESTIKSRPGIIDVTISYKPFWVFSTPKNTNKITITYEQNDSN